MENRKRTGTHCRSGKRYENGIKHYGHEFYDSLNLIVFCQTRSAKFVQQKSKRVQNRNSTHRDVFEKFAWRGFLYNFKCRIVFKFNRMTF